MRLPSHARQAPASDARLANVTALLAPTLATANLLIKPVETYKDMDDAWKNDTFFVLAGVLFDFDHGECTSPRAVSRGVASRRVPRTASHHAHCTFV